MLLTLLVAIALSLACLSAFISGIETALFSLKSFQIRRLHERNPGLAMALEELMENPRRLLGAILFADAMVNLPLIILSIFFMRHLALAMLPFWAMSLVIFAVIVLLCDLVPKLFALRQPYRIAQAGMIVLRRGMPLIEPVLRILQNFSERTAALLTPSKLQRSAVSGVDELETLVQISVEEGALDDGESGVIHGMIKLGNRTVRDCMTPRIGVFVIPDDLDNDEVIRRLRARRYQRVPVYAENPDNILGILDAKLFLQTPSIPYTEAMIPPSFVPETMRAADLLRSFLRHRQGMAVIVDEFGGTEGIITLPDLVEEIVGNVGSAGNQKLAIENLGGGRMIVDGSARLDDLRDLGFRLEENGIDTVGGLVFNRLGYLPKTGEVLSINNAKITVRSVSRKRVEEVLLVHTSNYGQEETKP